MKEKILKNKFLIIAFVVGLVVGISATSLTQVAQSSNTAKREARKHGYKVSSAETVIKAGDLGSNSGDIVTNYIYSDDAKMAPINSTTLESNEAAESYYKSQVEVLEMALKGTTSKEEKTDHSYFYEDDHFYYVGAVHDNVVYQISTDKNFPDNVSKMIGCFEELGCDLPKGAKKLKTTE